MLYESEHAQSTATGNTCDHIHFHGCFGTSSCCHMSLQPHGRTDPRTSRSFFHCKYSGGRRSRLADKREAINTCEFQNCSLADQTDTMCLDAIPKPDATSSLGKPREVLACGNAGHCLPTLGCSLSGHPEGVASVKVCCLIRHVAETCATSVAA